jgi:beta-galactosidase
MTEVNNEYTVDSTHVLTHQRDVVLFDMIARGLSLTHRPFDAIDLDRGDLDVRKTPLCWVMMERQCSAHTQQKLVDYVQRGGKLILAGRMCVEDFCHQACTILSDAIGIEQSHCDPPFAPGSLNAFGYQDVPVSFLEAYSGRFDEVYATRENGDVVGFIQGMGAGRVMMFGAAMAANTLDDLDIVHQMAMKMDCPPLFRLSDWADVRLSQGENGTFLFANNYQDDPVETTIEYQNRMLFGGHPLRLAPRSGLILPLDWQVRKGITIHYVTSEIAEITDDGARITLKTAQDEFIAEISLAGYHCERSTAIDKPADGQRIRIHGKEGAIELTRCL